MSVPEAASVRCDGPGPMRHRFYRALARTIEASRVPAAAVFVSAPDSLDLNLWVRPRALLDVVRADPVLSGATRDASDLRGLAPPETHGRFAVAIPNRRGYPVLAAGDPIDRPLSAPLVGPGGSLATQTLWAGGQGAGLWAARRWRYAAGSGAQVDERFEAISTALAGAWSVATGVPATPRQLGLGARSDWERLAGRSIPRIAWLSIGADRVESTPEPRWAPEAPYDPVALGHAVVLGASGAGKSCFLADRAARTIAGGGRVVAIDLHGDLTPAIVARLSPAARRRTVCVDLSDRPVPGISAIAPTVSPDRAAAHVVAALKRLTPDGGDVYWGFRLERILDAGVRIVQETGGSLLDLYALLTDPDRRDAARLATRSPELARFLEELGPIVRRTPDFLWASSSRLAKVVTVPSIAELLAPADGGLPVEELLADGRSLLVRLPFALLGPEAAAFAGTLVLARIYLGLAARRTEGARDTPVTVVLDEVQGISPRLVAEMLAEGRKFGFRLLLATQFPDRLAPELRSAVAGVVLDFVAFRIPPPGVPVAGSWLGMAPAHAERWLTDLSPGHAIARTPGDPFLRPIEPSPIPPEPDAAAWADAVRATRVEFAIDATPDRVPAPEDGVEERLLLAVLAAEESSRPLRAGEIVAAASRLPGTELDPALLEDRVRPLERSGFWEPLADGLHLTPAGTRRLGLGAPSGATRESAEHRGLLLRAFRIFARQGHLLEIVRQGRYDTRLPDGLFRQLPERARTGTAAELAVALDRIRGGWAWRFFGGLDVHVEAEVSGALRPARIRRGLAKARGHGAFTLFLVTDGHRAARVRSILRTDRVPISRAQVWTLPHWGSNGGVRGARPSADPPSGDGGRSRAEPAGPDSS
ncbi:MAG: hypothetical protein WBG19_04480 [Thermoplasmata archaeon]